MLMIHKEDFVGYFLRDVCFFQEASFNPVPNPDNKYSNFLL